MRKIKHHVAACSAIALGLFSGHSVAATYNLDYLQSVAYPPQKGSDYLDYVRPLVEQVPLHRLCEGAHPGR
jgi:hypothetical protein